MSTDATANPIRDEWSRWRSPRTKLVILPSWAVSLLFHAMLVIITASSLKSCDGTLMPGEPEGDFREVGIVVKQNTQLVERTDDAEHANDDANNTEAAANVGLAVKENLQLDDSPPVDIDVPLSKPNSPLIGLGRQVPASKVPGDIGEIVTPSGIKDRPNLTDLLKGKFEFFGVKDKGSRVVYLVDSSGSMANHPIRVAKLELMASLQTLDNTHQFQIIFYNTITRVMKRRGNPNVQMFWASDINRTLARNYISGINPVSGTDHLPALKKALRMAPDVLFFLTDAGEPYLTPGELDEIRKTNGGRTRIHCIEFGIGPDLKSDDKFLTDDNFLKRLARQNGGTHRYRDITKFDQR